jgi:hypothetical protein
VVWTSPPPQDASYNCWTRKLTVITNWFYVPSCMASAMGSSTFRGNFTFLQDTPPQEILRYCNCKLPRFTFFPKLNLHSWKSPQVFGDPMFELVFLSAGSLAICSRSSMRIRASSACSRRFKIWLHHTRNTNESPQLPFELLLRTGLETWQGWDQLLKTCQTICRSELSKTRTATCAPLQFARRLDHLAWDSKHW